MKRHVISPQHIAHAVAGVSAEEIDAHFNLLPDRYFAQTDESDVALHLAMVNRLLHNISGADSLGSLRPVIEWRDSPDRAHHVVHVVTWDRAGLFHKLAGALSVAGLNILSARITTRNDHIAIDSFEVEAAGPDFASAREAFARSVEEALVANRDLAAAIAAQSRLHAGSDATHPPSVDVYLEINSPRAIVEMHVPDRFGLLYRVGRVIAEAGFSLTSARVHTERGLAIDRFHLEAADDKPVDAARLNALREALLVASIR
jgi:[protein-PII] uridylyltransferase